MNRIFFISLYDNLLLVYRNETDLCVFILYPVTLLNTLISSKNFLVKSFHFSLYSIMSSANNGIFTSFFQVWMFFISFSCLIAVARTSDTILNKVAKLLFFSCS